MSECPNRAHWRRCAVTGNGITLHWGGGAISVNSVADSIAANGRSCPENGSVKCLSLFYGREVNYWPSTEPLDPKVLVLAMRGT
jgi:hypothetical protein